MIDVELDQIGSVFYKITSNSTYWYSLYQRAQSDVPTQLTIIAIGANKKSRIGCIMDK